METNPQVEENGQPPQAVKMSFFTRRLAYKLEQMGSAIPSSVQVFLDTPLSVFDEEQSKYFEQKFCPLIPNIVTVLEEIYNEMAADPEGWEDMMTYAGSMDTPIKICASAVLVKKEKEAQDVVSREIRAKQRTKKIHLPPGFNQLSATPR